MPGDTKTCITINIIDDDTAKPNEAFDVAFQPENIPSLPSFSTVIIIDDDMQGTYVHTYVWKSVVV